MYTLKPILITISFLLSLGRCDRVDPTRPPALIVRLTRDGLDTIAQGLTTVLPSLVAKAKAPDMSLNVSYTKIDLKRLAIKNFTLPMISYNLGAPNKIFIDLITGPIDGVAEWAAEKPIMFGKPLKDHGTLRLHMENFKASITAEIGNTYQNGLPSVAATGCQATITNANIGIKNATQKFFIDIMQTFSLVLRSVLQSQICSVAKSVIANDLNARIRAVPDILQCHDHGIGVRYLIQPVVTTDYIEASVRAVLETAPHGTGGQSAEGGHQHGNGGPPGNGGNGSPQGNGANGPNANPQGNSGPPGSGANVGPQGSGANGSPQGNNGNGSPQTPGTGNGSPARPQNGGGHDGHARRH